MRIRKAQVFVCWCKSMSAFSAARCGERHLRGRVGLLGLAESSAVGMLQCWAGTDGLTAVFGAQSRAAPLPVSRVEFLGYGGPFVWGSAVEWLPIFRVADPVLCEEKADGERGVCSCTPGSVFCCNLYPSASGCRCRTEQRLSAYVQFHLVMGLVSSLQK